MGGTMAARRKKKEVKYMILNGNLKNVLMGLATAGTIGVGGISYSQSTHADERTAKLETKVEKLEKDRDDHGKKLDRVDKRTIRMEEYLKLMGSKLGVKSSREKDED